MKSSCSKPTPRGRPRLTETAASAASVTTWLRCADYDRLQQLAKQERKTLSGLVRDLLKLKLG
jgi:hypothetical protein